MSHSTSTSHYNLPQFAATDKPAWLVDVNPAYSAIDAGMHAAQTAADAAQADATQALDDAAAASGAATTADAKASGAVASLAASFNTTSTYNINDIVIYNNLLYRCNSAVITPGPWSGSANWERVTVSEIIPSTASEIDYDNTNTSITADNVQGAITEVNDKFSTLKVIKTGKATYSGLKGGGWSDKVIVNITFDSPMPTAAYVAFAMVNDGYADFPYISIYPFNRTVNGFTATCINLSGSTVGVSGTFDWMVIGS